MNKLTKPVPDEDDFGPELSEAELEAWFARNREALNESIAQARKDHAEGRSKSWDGEEIMAEVREQLRKEGR
jgi:hypothetical protein